MFAPARHVAPSLSEKEAVILRLLIEHGDLFGLALVDKSAGELKRGTVYVTLDRMEDKGFVTSRQEARAEGAIGLPRRLYQVTGLGRKVLEVRDMATDSLLKGWVPT